MATHLVTGISWGANSVISCMYEKKDNQDEKKIEGILSGQLEKLSLAIKAKAELTDGEQDSNLKFDVRIFGDILPKNGDLPTSFEGAVALMRQLPSLVAECNGGKGKPLTYHLVPLELIQKYLKLEVIIDTTMISLRRESLLQVVHLFDQMTGAQQQLNAFYQDVNQHKYCVSNDDMTKISTLKFDMELEESRLRSELNSYLTQVRAGKKSATELEAFIRECQNSRNSPQRVSTILQGWKPIRDKISFATTLLENGATYVGLNTTLNGELMRNLDSKLYVLYFNGESIDSHQLIGNLMIFFDEIKKALEGRRYYAVDCDFHPHLLPKGKSSCVQIIERGNCIVEDLLKELEAKTPPGEAGVNENVSDAKILEPPTASLLVHWVRSRRDFIPPKALKGGQEGLNPMYVARATHRAGTIPGQLRWSGCYISWGNEEHRKEEYEVLAISEFLIDWVATSGSNIPDNAIPGGISESGETLYIGRAKHASAFKIGRVQRSDGMCYFGYFGKEYSSRQYKILVENSQLGFPLRGCNQQ